MAPMKKIPYNPAVPAGAETFVGREKELEKITSDLLTWRIFHRYQFEINFLMDTLEFNS